jgi:hypothetical protein
MKRSTKLVLSLTGLSLILIVVAAVGIGGYMFYSASVRNETARSTGEEFGKTSDSRGCVDESVRQFAEYKETGFLIRLEQFKIAHFTTGCLGTAKPTVDFCKGVPKNTFLDSLQWTVAQCTAAGLNKDGPCNEIFKTVVVYCATKAGGK